MNLPPPLPAAASPFPQPARALGEDPDDLPPINGVFGAVEATLRQPRRVMYQLHQGRSGGLIFALLAVAIVCAAIYGFIAGTFSMGDQLWAAPVKIAGGLLFSAMICLPSLYIFSCLGGSQARLIEVAGLMAGLLALLTVLLVGFAPVAWVFSQSTNSVAAMGALHLAFGFIATYFGLRFLHAGFGHLNARPAGMHVWSCILLLVLLQMTTALRPIIGRSDRFFPAEKKFFTVHWGEVLK
jgi:hypothetical protein